MKKHLRITTAAFAVLALALTACDDNGADDGVDDGLNGDGVEDTNGLEDDGVDDGLDDDPEDDLGEDDDL